MKWSEFERKLSAYIDDEASPETRLEMEAFMDENEEARAAFESHLTVWEAAQSSADHPAPDGLWAGIEEALGPEGGGTSLQELALMIRGLAGEVQDLRREVQSLRRVRRAQESEQPLPTDRENEESIRVRTLPFYPEPEQSRHSAG